MASLALRRCFVRCLLSRISVCNNILHPFRVKIDSHDTGCWRDPLPFVEKTAIKLVSNLAVLFHTLAEDVRSLAEGAGLKWKWRRVKGCTVDEGDWEGDCDKVHMWMQTWCCFVYSGYEGMDPAFHIRPWFAPITTAFMID